MEALHGPQGVGPSPKAAAAEAELGDHTCQHETSRHPAASGSGQGHSSRRGGLMRAFSLDTGATQALSATSQTEGPP